MPILKKQGQQKTGLSPEPKILLKTDWPLCGKDEQAKAIERSQQLQKGVRAKWEG
jgi:hypothetical protein